MSIYNRWLSYAGLLSLSVQIVIGQTILLRSIYDSSRFSTQVIAGAPFSAEQITECKQRSPYGAVTRVVASQLVYRDSYGRTRIEQTITRPSNVKFVVIELHDPLRGTHYIIDTLGRVAHRIVVDRSSSHTRMDLVAKGPSQRVPPYSRGQQFTHESLGTSIIDGVVVEGSSTSQISNGTPGGIGGMAAPAASTTETWISRSLQLVILSRHQDLKGIVEVKMKNIRRAEPDAALFAVPFGYVIVNEAPTFTFTVTKPHG